MALELSGQSESLPALLRAELGKEAYQKVAHGLEKIYRIPALALEPYREFYGQPRVQMPLLESGEDEKGNVIDVPRDSVSFAKVIERRIDTSGDVREAWNNHNIWTGDGSIAGAEGDHLIVLDTQELDKRIQMTPKSELYAGALVLPQCVWPELKEQSREYSGIVYLTANEVKEADGKGYVKKNGVWAPANRSVGKVWDVLVGGRDLTSYVQLVSEHDRLMKESLLTVWFNKTLKHTQSQLDAAYYYGSKEYGKSTMRLWVAAPIDGSQADGQNSNLNSPHGRLIGVTPEVLAYGK